VSQTTKLCPRIRVEEEGFTRVTLCAYLNPVMFPTSSRPQPSEISLLLDCLARTSSRPRYAFMVLSLIAEVASPEGEAGPFIRRSQEQLTLRDFLCDSLTPMGMRAPRRRALTERVASDLARQKLLPADPDAAEHMINDEVHRRVRASGKTNLSRAVSELVSAGLLKRYYKGYAVDHENRGAQRHAVYVLCGIARCLVRSRASSSISSTELTAAFRPAPQQTMPLLHFSGLE